MKIFGLVGERRYINISSFSTHQKHQLDCKIFAWRALHGILPLKSILANQHVAAEDITHLLFLCPMAQSLWRSLGIHEFIEDATIVDRSGSVVLEFIFDESG
jgi:hypothetical protein